MTILGKLAATDALLLLIAGFCWVYINESRSFDREFKRQAEGIAKITFFTLVAFAVLFIFLKIWGVN